MTDFALGNLLKMFAGADLEVSTFCARNAHLVNQERRLGFFLSQFLGALWSPKVTLGLANAMLQRT